MALRPIAFSIPSTTQLKVTFSDSLAENISADNFQVASLNGAVNDLEVLGVTIDGQIATIKTRPQVSKNYYLLKFIDTQEVTFTSEKGERIPFDSVSRELFFVGIDNVNPFRDRMYKSLPDIFEIENTVVSNIISAQAEEFYTAQKTIGEVLSNNYLCVDVVDEPRTRSAGATDRMANENAYEVVRVARTQTDSNPIFEVLDYTSSNSLPRSEVLPVYPISLRQVAVEDEEINLSTESNSFDGFLLNLRNRNVIKVLSVKYIANGDIEDCNGNIGVEYNVERYKYSIKDNFYDQNYAFEFSGLEDNQVLLSEFGNIPKPSVLDTFIVSYLYSNKGRHVIEEQVEVNRVEESINESIPTNVTSFFLDNAPIVNINNALMSLKGVVFRAAENSTEVPAEFKTELVFNSNSLPSRLGEYSINYDTGEVFLVGADIVGEGTGSNNYVATYYYRREFLRDLDYSIHNQDLVATPGRDLANKEAEIFIRYEEVFAEGIDYLAKTHIEVMPEFVENRLSQSFRVETLNAPITDVFRVFNQTTGEVYKTLFHTDTEIAFSGNRSPEVKNTDFEEASFKREVDEELQVIGEFIIPAFNTIITSSISNNNITFSPGIPAELISQNSLDYFFRETNTDGNDVGVEDTNIRFFGTPDSNNLITSAGINYSATAPTNGSQVVIGTRGFVINLGQEGLMNQNLDSIGSLINSSAVFDNPDVFTSEKFFRPIKVNPGTVGTTGGGISRALTQNKGTEFTDSLSRLRKVGDYCIDYNHGIVYVAISRNQDISVGSISYFHNSIDAKNNNIITVSSVSKKKNSPEPLTEAQIVYSDVVHDNNTITAMDIESTLLEYDGITKALTTNGNRELICTVLEDYTVVLPHSINSINGIYNISDLTGIDLSSSSEANRVEEYSAEELVLPVIQGGRNLYDSTSVTFEGNIIDFKKKQNRRLSSTGTSYSITINDATASTFIQAINLTTGDVIFDEDLNITKIGGLQVAASVLGVGTAEIAIASGVDLTSVDTDGTDFLLDAEGNRFKIIGVDTLMSSITVTSPADNNILVSLPVVDPAGTTEIIIKPTVTFISDTMIIDIPLDAGLAAGDLLEITYLTTLIPAVGTALAIDYRFGFIFTEYAYLADEIVIWYEYGDNTLDWSISDAITEGDEYFVTYKYGALREALRVNFGSLTNIPFFQAFGVNTNRELYRNAIKGTLQSFPKGPTIPAYEQLVKSFTQINPNIDELIFGNWILGRDYLYPGKIKYEGVLDFSECRFDEGLVFNDDVTVSVPALSSIALDEGTIEAWVRPEWAGINNDATLTFYLENIGEEKVFLNSNDNPFDAEHNWDMFPTTNLVGGTDILGPGINIFNYRSNESAPYGLDVGIFGLYKNQPNLSRLINSRFSATMRGGIFGPHFNDLRKVFTEPGNYIEMCEDEENPKRYFIVGCHGPGNFVEGPWPFTLEAPIIAYNVGSFIIPDGERTVGINMNLNEISGFKYEVSPMVSDSGIVSITSNEIPRYNRHHYTRGCNCSIINTIPELEKFNEMLITVELEDAFDFTEFKSGCNIIDDSPDVLVLVDTDGIAYQMVGYYDDNDTIVTNGIPDSASRLIFKKFGINNPALSAMGSEAINEILPNGILRLLYKSVDIITKFDYSNSIQAFGFEKCHVLDWENFHRYDVVRTPCDNIVDVVIDGQVNRMFYTDAFFSCNLAFSSTVDPEDLRGVMIGMLGGASLANLELLRGNGVLYNRYNLDDIYIGNEGFNPTRSPFALNRGDIPNSPVGEPPGASDKEGIYIWFDELCRSPLSDNEGQWIVRTRSSRNVECPVDVVFTEEGYTNVPGNFFPNHKFAGKITTDGEFSSVSRAFREETQGGCDTGVICKSTFRYCGNELLEDFGWSKIEDSDSDFINLVVGGRETQKGDWRKHGEFTTNTSTGIYRMGPSVHDMNCVDEINYLGNLVYTQNPCAGGDFEYIVSMRVTQIDTALSLGTSGSFSGAISGVITGIVPIHINDREIDLKVALALSSTDQPLVLIIDSISNQILDIIQFLWNDQEFHEYRVEKDKDNGNITLYIDNLLVSQILLTDFSEPVFDINSDFTNANIGIYLLDASLVDSEVFHRENSGNIIDVDLVFFSGIQVEGDGYLEVSDVLINTDHKIEFCFSIDDFDGYSSSDGYDGYTEFIGVDEMFITSDKLRYLVDTGIGESDSRFSIFKDGKGFLNFRIFDDSISNGYQVGMFNLATNIKHFKPGELHHIAASWKLNTIEEKDEMHIFIDGKEAPNIFKFGGRVPVRISDKFRDVSKEVLYDFLVDDINFCENYVDGTISAESAIFQSATATFTQDMVGRSLIFTASTLAPTLVGGEYIIKSVIDGSQVTLGTGDNLDLITFQTSSSDIEFQFAPTAGVIAPVLTDLRNSRLAIFRTTPDGLTEEMAGVFYTVSNGEINILKGGNVTKPKFRANIDTRIIEFVGEDNLCNYVATIEPTDIDVHIETYGLNLENCKFKLNLSGSSYITEHDTFSGQSVIRSRGAEPVSLNDVVITRIIMDRTVVDILDPISLPELGYQVDFEIELENVNGVNNVSSQPGIVDKQNLGRLLTLFFDSDNVNYCKFDGYEDGYQDGYLDGEINTITVYGTTTDGINEETFYVNKNGNLNGNKFFTSVDRIAGSLIVVDPDHFEAALIELRETNSVTVSDNGGSRAEVYEYKSGHLIITTVGSGGTFPFELHAGTYDIEYPAYLTLNLPHVGHDMYIGSDFNGKNQFGGIIDQFRVISEMSSDTRITEFTTAGTRSVTDDYNKSIPHCPDSQTLTLIHFDNPIDLQSRRLRNTEFLDTDANVKYTLDTLDREELLLYANDELNFTSKMVNDGFTLDESIKTFYEVHKAEGGPLFNEADFYRNVEEFPKSDSSVNTSFKKSGNFTSGRGLLYLNNDGKFKKGEGTIEFWVSPAIDTFVDREKRYFVDIFSGNRERFTSKTSTVIELPNPAGEIISVKLLKSTREFSGFYDTSEASTILFDEISRSPISGILEGGTGTDKDFSVGSRLSADGRKIYLAESLPGQKIDVMVTYIPLGADGDRFSIFKNEFNQIVFAITADGIDNIVTIDIDWKKNSWHRVMCNYRTGTGNDTMRIFVDGEEGGYIQYGTGIIYGTGYIYGQFIQGTDGRSREFNIPLGDEFKLIAIGSDIFGDQNSRSRMDNIRFSRIIRNMVQDTGGNSIDLNYSENLNTVAPVVKDDVTTLMINFDAVIEKIDKFATVIDPVGGIYSFDIEVIDNFNKVIGVNDGEVEDLIVELVDRLKPAHTNALVKFTKSKR